MEDSFRDKQAQEIKVNPVLTSRPRARLLAVGVFLFVLIGSGVVYFWHKDFNQDKLMQLAPVDSVVYFYARNSFWDQRLNRPAALDDLPFTNFYNNTKFDFAKNLLPLSTHTAYIQFLVNDQLTSVWLFELKQPADNTSWVFELPDYKVFDKKTLAVSESAEALKIIEEVNEGKIFSLSSQLGLSKDQVSLFIKSKNLHLVNTAKLWSKLFTQDLYISLNQTANIWQVDLRQDIASSEIKNQNLTLKLPEDFNLFISGINLSVIFNQWAGADEALNSTLMQSQEVYRAAFNFNLSDVKREVLDSQSDIIIFPSANDTALGVDYILITNQPSESGLRGLEDLIKVVLAQKLPQKAIRYLPDGSSVTELSVNTEAWNWGVINIGDKSAQYIAEPELNLEMVYLLDNGRLLVSNSQSRLADFVTKPGKDLAQYQAACPGNLFESSYIIFNQSSNLITILLGENNLATSGLDTTPGKTLILGKNNGCLGVF